MKAESKSFNDGNFIKGSYHQKEEKMPLNLLQENWLFGGVSASESEHRTEKERSLLRGA